MTYPTNATYMAAVAGLDVRVPEQVPMAALHPNDRAAIVLKRSTHYDSVPPEHIIHFRRVYFSMCVEADSLLGKVIDALDSSGAGVRQRSYVMMISDHGEDNIEHRVTGKNNMCAASTTPPSAAASTRRLLRKDSAEGARPGAGQVRQREPRRDAAERTGRPCWAERGRPRQPERRLPHGARDGGGAAAARAGWALASAAD